MERRETCHVDHRIARSGAQTFACVAIGLILGAATVAIGFLAGLVSQQIETIIRRD